MKAIKLETIKARVARLYSEEFNKGGSNMSEGWRASTYASVLRFAHATSAEREEMRAFAEGFQPSAKVLPGPDYLAYSAQNGDGRKARWYQVMLAAREAGLDLIRRWDARRIGKLIELFPDSVPPGWRGKQLNCWIADNEDGDWMVGLA